MTIRPATENDLPAMLELSKQSLGEMEGMRTVEYWRWKHILNPFGASPVLLALEEDRLIGLRAFMRWRFSYQGKTIDAYRAVDTATHPEYQGKGIFSTLTLKLIEQLQARDPAIIFNTPNSKSMPGYLKMGWKTVGKTRLLTKVFPWHVAWNWVINPTRKTEGEHFQIPDDMDHILHEWMEANREWVQTDYSVNYLQWRYQDIPVLKYRLHVARQDNSICVVVYRMKTSRRVNELRLTEVFHVGREAKKVLRKAVREIAKLHKPDVMTLLADPTGKLSALLPFGFVRTDKHGLTITCRKVNSDTLEALALNHDVWTLSAGTLELF